MCFVKLTIDLGPDLFLTFVYKAIKLASFEYLQYITLASYRFQ